DLAGDAVSGDHDGVAFSGGLGGAAVSGAAVSGAAVGGAAVGGGSGPAGHAARGQGRRGGQGQGGAKGTGAFHKGTPPLVVFGGQKQGSPRRIPTAYHVLRGKATKEHFFARKAHTCPGGLAARACQTVEKVENPLPAADVRRLFF